LNTKLNPSLNKRISKLVRFIPAVDVDLQVERDNGFVAMVLGNFVLSLLYQNSAVFGLNGYFGKAILGLNVAFVLNFLHFDIDNHHFVRHALTLHRLRGTSRSF
jgi:hypothetical protein